MRTALGCLTRVDGWHGFAFWGWWRDLNKGSAENLTFSEMLILPTINETQPRSLTI